VGLSSPVSKAFAQDEQASQAEIAQDPVDTNPDGEFQFLGPDGKPLPAEVQAQLREQLKNRPPQSGNKDKEIVVAARRPRGSIPFDDVPERSYSQLDVKGFGADTVEDLIDALGAQVSNPTALDASPPVLLLNGRRVANPLDIAQLPTEAIERLDVYPPQLAARYGLRNDLKIVNIVTFEKFASVFGLGKGRVASEGGFSGADGAVDLVRLNGDLRLGLGASYLRSSNLTEQERNVVQPVESEDQASVRSLLPELEVAEINANIAHPIGTTASASATGRYRFEESDALVGALNQSALRRVSKVQQVDIGANFTQQFDKILLSANASYTDLSRTSDIASRSDSLILDFAEFLRSELSADIGVSGSITQLSEGTLSGSANIELGTAEADSFALRAVPEPDSQRTRDFGRASLGLSLPIAGPDSSVGVITASFNGIVTSFSDVTDTWALDASLDWAIDKNVRLSFFWSDKALPPTLEQLVQPRLISPNIRTFDFVAGETVDVDYITGGNPNLLNEERQAYQVRLSVRPFRRHDLTFNATFSSIRSDNAIAEFPLLTTTTTNAFPDRFTRSTTGALETIDIRPINFSRTVQDQIYWGLSFSRPLGPAAEGYRSQGYAIRTVDEAQQAYPDSVILTAPPNSGLARQAENLASRVFFDLYHTWYTRDTIRLARTDPTLDLLDGDAIDFLGGRRQHRIDLIGGVYWSGLGIRMKANWNSSTSLIDITPDGEQKIRFGDYAVVDVSFFANLAETFSISEKAAWLKNTRVTFEVSNLFNQRPSAETASGSTPLRFQNTLLDPIGRTFSLSLRKVF
jgi:hypothetical protein